MKLLYHEAKLASLSYILVLNRRYLAAYEIANVFTKKAALHLHFLRSVSLTRPALLKHFKGTANRAGPIWSQQALVPSISVPSLQDWGWISLRREWRLSCTPLSEITKLRVELVKYARKKGYAQKSDNRERQSPTLFFDYKLSSA